MAFKEYENLELIRALFVLLLSGARSLSRTMACHKPRLLGWLLFGSVTGYSTTLLPQTKWKKNLECAALKNRNGEAVGRLSLFCIRGYQPVHP